MSIEFTIIFSSFRNISILTHVPGILEFPFNSEHDADTVFSGSLFILKVKSNEIC